MKDKNMAVSSSDLYPYSVYDLGRILGITTGAVYGRMSRIEVDETEWNYVGSSKRYTRSVLLKLQDMKTRRVVDGKPIVPKRVFETPLGTVYIESDIPLASTSGMELYPFHILQPGQSFAVEKANKSTLEKMVTEANKKLAPAKFTRRFYDKTAQIRVWRSE